MAIALRSDISIEAAPEDVEMSSARLHNVTRLVQSYLDDGKPRATIYSALLE
jgi:hypothetical protein